MAAHPEKLSVKAIGFGTGRECLLQSASGGLQFNTPRPLAPFVHFCGDFGCRILLQTAMGAVSGG